MLLNILRKNGVLSFGDNSKIFSTPTGFTVIDALGATLELDVNGNLYLNGGLANKFYMKTGQSGTGKTTLAIQTCAYGVEWWNSKYPDKEPSDFIIFDAEDNLTINRISDLTNWDAEYIDKHLSLRKDVDIKEIYNTIMKLVDIKSKNKDNYYLETGILDIDGRPLKSWVPTYILIDSLAAIKSRVGLDSVERDRNGDIKNMNISENIDAMREAKDNIDFIFKIKPLCNDYGIYLGIINHIVDEQKMSMFDVSTRYLTTLRAGEKLRGGKELIYQAYGIDRVGLKEKLGAKNPIYGEDFDGMINEFIYIKSKNHGEGIPYRFVMSKREGYKPELSDFEFLFSNNYGINGAGVSMSMMILPEIKFSRKTLLEKCHMYPELARAIQFTAKILIINLLLLDKDSGPDLSFLTNLGYEQRISYIFSFTNPYPGYKHEIYNKELLEALARKDFYIRKSNSSVELNNSYFNDIFMCFLNSDEEGIPSFIPPGDNSVYQTPFDDLSKTIEFEGFNIK